MLINYLVNFIKTISMTTCITFTTFKIKNIKTVTKKNKCLIILLNIIVATIYAFIYQNFSNYEISSVTNLLCYILYSLIFIYIIEVPFLHGIVLSIISITVTFITKFLAGVVNFIFIQLHIFDNKIVQYISLAIIQFILLYLFFKIRRFKDGISFLKEGNYYKKIDDIGWIISILIIFFCTVLSTIKEYSIRTGVAIILGTGGLLMINWVRKNITKHYKEKMRDRTVEIQAEQLKEKDEVINKLKEELSNVLKINHKYNHRISAMEKLVSKLNFNEEFANEYSDIIDSINDLSDEYKTELSSLENQDSLPKTKIFSIDNLLEYMRMEAKKSNISFDLQLECNVNDMIENFIQKGRLETLLADHLKDAIISINSSNNSYKNIMMKICKSNEIYEILIYDTGIEFEIETLLKLGLKPITTHKNEGGSGIGFMTTFETLKECKASLIIEEYNPETTNYTKSLIVRFDNKNNYIIRSYRAEEIRAKSIDSRVIVENM